MKFGLKAMIGIMVGFTAGILGDYFSLSDWVVVPIIIGLATLFFFWVDRISK